MAPPSASDLYDCIEKNETVLEYLKPVLPYYYSSLTSTDIIENLMTQNVNDETVLHLALRLNKLDIAMELIKLINTLPRHIQLTICNSQDAIGGTAAHFACLSRKDEVSVTKLLEEFGNHILYESNRIESNQMSLFVDENMTRLLVQIGATTAANLEKDPSSIASKLKELGVDLNMVDTCGNTPLHYACSIEKNSLPEHFTGSFEQVIIVLVQGGAPNTANLEGRTPLHMACGYSCYDGFVRALLGISVIRLNVVDSDGNTPLHLACGNDDENEVAHMLIRKSKMEVNVRNKHGDTPLHLAAKMGHSSFVEKLMNSGSDPSIKNNDDEYPLHCACLSFPVKKEVIKWLMEAYPNAVREKNRKGKSPLIVACQNANWKFETMEELFQHKILPLVGAVGADNEGRRPIYYLCTHYAVDCDSLLLIMKHGKDPNGYFGRDIASTMELVKNSDAIEVIIRFLMDPKIADSRWSKPTTSVLPAPYDPRLLQKFIIDLDALHSDPIQSTCEDIVSAAKVGCAYFLQKRIADLLNVDKSLFYDTYFSKLLDVSVQYPYEGILATLLECIPADAWSHSVRKLDGKGIWLLITKFPHLALKVFDKCIDKNDNKELELDFSLLRASQLTYCIPYLTVDADVEQVSALNKVKNGSVALEPDSDCHQPAAVAPSTIYLDPFNDNPIRLIIKSDKNNKQEKLIDHPLVRVFVLSQWCTYGRLLNLLLFVWLYGIFLGFLTALFLLQEFSLFEELNSTVPVSNATTYANMTMDENRREKWIAVLLVVWSIGNILKEIFELRQKGRRYSSIENVLEIILYILALLFATLYIITNYYRSNSLEMWQWRLSGITVFFGWINLTLFLRKTPVGITVIAFEKIFVTFLHHFPILFIFTFAFSACFYGFLHSSPFFRYTRPLLKVAVLIVGDYPTLDHILGIDAIEDTKLNEFDSGFGAAIFLVFLCVMTIVMMNMLVGIAVDEISKVLKDSEINSLAMKAEWLVGVRKFQQYGRNPLRLLLTWYLGLCYGGQNIDPYVYTVVVKSDQYWFTKWLNSDLAEAEQRALSLWESCHTTEPQAMVLSNLQSDLAATKQLVLSLTSLPREIDNIKAALGTIEKKQQHPFGTIGMSVATQTSRPMAFE